MYNSLLALRMARAASRNVSCTLYITVVVKLIQWESSVMATQSKPWTCISCLVCPIGLCHMYYWLLGLYLPNWQSCSISHLLDRVAVDEAIHLVWLLDQFWYWDWVGPLGKGRGTGGNWSGTEDVFIYFFTNTPGIHVHVVGFQVGLLWGMN